MGKKRPSPPLGLEPLSGFQVFSCDFPCFGRAIHTNHFHLAPKNSLFCQQRQNRWPFMNKHHKQNRTKQTRSKNSSDDSPLAHAKLSGTQTQRLLITICASTGQTMMTVWRFNKYTQSSTNRCNDSHSKMKTLCAMCTGTQRRTDLTTLSLFLSTGLRASLGHGPGWSWETELCYVITGLGTENKYVNNWFRKQHSSEGSFIFHHQGSKVGSDATGCSHNARSGAAPRVSCQGTTRGLLLSRRLLGEWNSHQMVERSGSTQYWYWVNSFCKIIFRTILKRC